MTTGQQDKPSKEQSWDNEFLFRYLFKSSTIRYRQTVKKSHIFWDIVILAISHRICNYEIYQSNQSIESIWTAINLTQHQAEFRSTGLFFTLGQYTQSKIYLDRTKRASPKQVIILVSPGFGWLQATPPFPSGSLAQRGFPPQREGSMSCRREPATNSITNTTTQIPRKSTNTKSRDQCQREKIFLHVLKVEKLKTEHLP